MLITLILLILGGLVVVWWLNVRDAEAARAAKAAAEFDSSEVRHLAEVRGELEQAFRGEEPILALVFFDGAPDLSIERIRRELEKRWSYPAELGEVSSTVPLQRTLLLAETQLLFEPVAELHADELLHRALADSGGAAATMGAGQIGLVVAAGTRLGALGRAVILSQALLAVLESSKAANAVFWDPSRALLPRRDAKKRLAVDYEHALPLELWVSVHTQEVDGRVRGFTRGLASLDTSEFEAVDAPESPSELESRLLALARYAVLSCRTIFNGDTTGVDEFERIKLVKAPSETVHKGWVFQLHYLKPSRQNPWQR